MNERSAADISSPEFKRDPYPFYKRLREERPAVKVRLADGQIAWLFGRYDDVSRLLKDPRLAKDRRHAPAAPGAPTGPQIPSFLKPLTQSMLDRDDPDHARLRRLIQATFTPPRVEMLRCRTQAIAEALLDRIARLGTVDLIEDYAMPLPVTVISELLGVPAPDQKKFARWSRTLIAVGSNRFRILTALPDLLALVRYLRQLVAVKRAFPEDDLTSALTAASDGDDALSGDELSSMLAILLTAGHETTTNLIGNGVFALLHHPDQLDRLRQQPELLMNSAVEEILRFESPVATTTNRYAREDIELGGQSLNRGDVVVGALTSANRDETRFAGGDTFDIGRNPNKHLTFGQGGHYCIGAPLARLEGHIAFTALLNRFRVIRVVAEPHAGVWRRGMVLRGLKRLPIAVER